MATATALLLVIDAMGIPTLEYLIDHFPGNLHFPNLSRLGLGLLMPPRHSCRFYPHGRRICAGRRDQVSASADSVIVSIKSPSNQTTVPSGNVNIKAKITSLDKLKNVKGVIKVVKENHLKYNRP